VLDSYRYGFQGQEKDDEVKGEGNSLNFELRMLDTRIARWFAIDPYKQYASPYLGMGNNPISMIDPDGGKALWVPNKDTGNLEAQKGDNAKTLAKNLSISEIDAQKMISDQKLKLDKNGNVLENQVLALDNVYTDALRPNTGKDQYDEVTGNKDFYTCFTSCIKGSAGEVLREPGKSYNNIKFDGHLKYEFTETTPNKLIFGKSVIRLVDKYNKAHHGVVYYGTDKEGAIYVFSKNGPYYYPKILPLDDVIKDYNKIQGVKNNKSFIDDLMFWEDEKPEYQSGYYNPIK